MSNIRNLNRNTKAIAMIAIFAALYAALRIVPTVPMIGTGSAFHLSDILAPLYGILLGPFIGGAAILIGTFAGIGLNGSMPFLGLDFLPAFVVAISLGLLVRKKWLPVVILNAALLLLVAFDPFTLNIIQTPFGPFPFLWLHIVAFVVLLSPLGRKAGEWVKDTAINTEKRTKKTVWAITGGLLTLISGASILIWGLTNAGTNGIAVDVMGAIILIAGAATGVYKAKITKITAGFAILAFIGTMMQHLTGNLLYETVFGSIGSLTMADFVSTWNIVFYTYPVERLVFIIGAVIVGVPVTRALQRFFHNTYNKSPTQAKPEQPAPQ